MSNATAIVPELERTGQHALASYLGSCDPAHADAIAAQLDRFDLDHLARLIDRYGRAYEPPPIDTDLEPAPYYALGGQWDRDAYEHAGEDLVRAGKVACFVVAGGQGSRLGFEGPKGCFPAACVSGKPLFAIFAESIRTAQEQYDATIPWLVMTSPLNHDETVGFFGEHDHFGLDPDDVFFFNQGVMPSFDKETGDLLLSAPDALATNPDGHGGAYGAIERSGTLDELERRGVEHLSYFQVDNPHTRIIDPVFLGLHATAPDSSGEISSKMVAKTAWDEKVGVFCRAGGRTRIVEYSDLPESLAKKTTPDGTLAFDAGSVALHTMSLAFIRKVLADPERALPFHRAVKKVPYFDTQRAERIEPEEPNGIKLERFVFDALGVADRSIVIETDRIEEFAPVKNAAGTDSIESSKRLQTERAARWLERYGVQIPRDGEGGVDATIEIPPRVALCAEDLKGRDLPDRIDRGAEVIIG